MTTKTIGIRPRGIGGMVWDLNNPTVRLDEYIAQRPRVAALLVVEQRNVKQRELAERVRKRK